jgi:hypothetical protein
MQITCETYHVKRFLIDLHCKTKAPATEFRPLFVKVLRKAGIAKSPGSSSSRNKLRNYL